VLRLEGRERERETKERERVRVCVCTHATNTSNTGRPAYFLLHPDDVTLLSLLAYVCVCMVIYILLFSHCVRSKPTTEECDREEKRRETMVIFSYLCVLSLSLSISLSLSLSVCVCVCVTLYLSSF
jgi:hypothetical protein